MFHPILHYVFCGGHLEFQICAKNETHWDYPTTIHIKFGVNKSFSLISLQDHTASQVLIVFSISIQFLEFFTHFPIIKIDNGLTPPHTL